MKFLIAFTLFLTCIAVSASPLPDFPFVTVSAESSRQVPPDQATIELQILVFEKRAEQAQQALAKTKSTLLDILESNHINLNQISSNEVNKRTKRARDNKSYEELEILGYELSQRFEITLNNIDKYPNLITHMMKTDNVINISSRFDTSERDALTSELVAEAGKQAAEKAKQMAAGLGVRLGGVFAINDTGSFQRFFATFGLQSQSQLFASHSEARSRKSSARTSFVPEYIELTKRINVVYKLSQ